MLASSSALKRQIKRQEDGSSVAKSASYVTDNRTHNSDEEVDDNAHAGSSYSINYLPPSLVSLEVDPWSTSTARQRQPGDEGLTQARQSDDASSGRGPGISHR